MAIALAGGHAHGLGALVRRTVGEDIERLKRIAEERQVAGIVIGLPLNMDGSEGAMAREVRAFGGQLARQTGLEVFFQDERLTSFEAEDRLKERGMGLKRMLAAKRRGAVDEMAAVILLEDFLNGRGIER